MHLLIALIIGTAYGLLAWGIQVLPTYTNPNRGITPNQLRLVMAMPTVVTAVGARKAFDWPIVLGAAATSYLITLLAMRARTQPRNDGETITENDARAMLTVTGSAGAAPELYSGRAG